MDQVAAEQQQVCLVVSIDRVLAHLRIRQTDSRDAIAHFYYDITTPQLTAQCDALRAKQRDVELLEQSVGVRAQELDDLMAQAAQSHEGALMTQVDAAAQIARMSENEMALAAQQKLLEETQRALDDARAALSQRVRITSTRRRVQPLEACMLGSDGFFCGDANRAGAQT